MTERPAVRTSDEIKAEHGLTSPEYAARVYEDMLDAAYERRARADAEIEKIGAHLEREKAELMRQRRARKRRHEWEVYTGEAESRS